MWVLGRVVPQPGITAFYLGWLLTPELQAPEILRELGLQGHSLAQGRGQWTGGSQAASVSSPCWPAPGRGCAQLWQISLSWGLLVGQQAPGGGGKPWLAQLGHLRGVEGVGASRQQETPLKTLASPWSVPTQPTTPTVGGGTAPFLAVTVPILLPSPRAGRKYLVLLVLGTGSKHCET